MFFFVLFFQFFNHFLWLCFVIWLFKYLNDKNLSFVIIFDKKTDFASWFAFSFSDMFECSRIQCMWTVFVKLLIVSQISSAKKWVEFSMHRIAFWLSVKIHIWIEFCNVLNHWTAFSIAYNFSSFMLISTSKFHVLYATRDWRYKVHDAIEIFVFESYTASV